MREQYSILKMRKVKLAKWYRQGDTIAPDVCVLKLHQALLGTAVRDGSELWSLTSLWTRAKLQSYLGYKQEENQCRLKRGR